VLVCDTSGLVAYFDASDAHHLAVSAIIQPDPGPFIVSPYVVAELDYLLASRRGVQAELAVLTALASGAWELVCCDSTDLRQAQSIVQRYRDQDIGLTDASLVLLCARYRTDRLLTLDRRHFQVVRTMTGEAFKILP